MLESCARAVDEVEALLGCEFGEVEALSPIQSISISAFGLFVWKGCLLAATYRRPTNLRFPELQIAHPAYEQYSVRFPLLLLLGTENAADVERGEPCWCTA